MIFYPIVIPIDSGPPCNEAQANKMGDTCMSTVSISVLHDMLSAIGAYYGWVIMFVFTLWFGNKMLRSYVRALR